MASILTNTSAMSALQSLAATQASLAKVQKQISTGLAINDASDNAGIWSLATGLRGDVASLGAVSNSISLGTSIVSTASAGMNSALNLLQAMQSQLNTVVTSGTNIAAPSGGSLTAIQSSINSEQQSIVALMAATSFSGVNLLDGSQTTTNIVDSYDRTSSGSSTGLMTIASSTMALGGTTTSTPTSTTGSGFLGKSLGLSSLAGTSGYASSVTSGATTTYNGTFAQDSILGFSLSSTTTSSDFNKLYTAVTNAITNITNASAQLGADSNVLSNQGTSITSVTNNLNAGIGALVDADMNAASTRLQALQVQQTLGIQALSIANENSQAILKLFDS